MIPPCINTMNVWNWADNHYIAFLIALAIVAHAIMYILRLFVYLVRPPQTVMQVIKVERPKTDGSDPGV